MEERGQGLKIARERVRIKNALLDRMENGEVLIISDFNPLIDLGNVTIEDLLELGGTTLTGSYKSALLFFNPDATEGTLDFEKACQRIDAEQENKAQRLQTFGWNYNARFQEG